MPSIPELIQLLPKAELHVHLEGTLEPELLFELARRNGVSLEFDSVEALRNAYVFDNLQEFLDIYYIGMEVLQTENDYYELGMAYFHRAARDNVRHVEAFFDPQAHTERGVAMDAVISGFSAAATEAQRLGVSVYLIACILRHLPASDATRMFDALSPHIDRIHGIGLDSSELNHPPRQFADVYSRARSHGLKCVAHAGEEGPPDYVWQALDELRVDRIDHGNRAMEDERLIRRLAREGIPLTVCPLSNLNLGVVSTLEEHPLKEMLEKGLVATVNSDDPAYFGGYVNDNYRHIAQAVHLSPGDICLLARNSFQASFLSDETKARWINEIDKIDANISNWSHSD